MRATIALALLACLSCASRRTGLGLGVPIDVEAQCAAAERARKPDAALRGLLADRDPSVRGRAALAVGRIGDAQAVQALAALLPDPAAGELAAWALGRLDGGEAALVACVRATCPAAAAAARALGTEKRGREALLALGGALAGGAPLAVEAAHALGIVSRGGKDADAAVAAAAGRALASALARPEPEVRAAAAYAIGKTPLFDARGGALAAVLRDSSAEARALGARAWGRQRLAAPALAPLLADADWRVRVEAARALAGAPGAAAVIAAALPAAVQAAAAEGVAEARWAHPLAALLLAAGKSGGAALAAVPEPASLKAATTPATVAVRCAAAEAKDRVAGALLATPTCGAGLEPEWRSRARTAALAAELAAAQRAGPTTPTAPVPTAVALLADLDARVRASAANAAGLALAGALLPLLADSDPFVVAAAAGSLAKDPRTAAGAREAAVRALAALSPARALPAGDPAGDTLTSLATLLGAGAGPAASAAAAGAAPDESGEGQAKASAALASLLPVGSLPLHRAIVAALRALGAPDSSARAPAPPLPAAAEAGLPGNGPRARTLRLKTTAGELVVRLHADDGEAPLTSAAVAALARRGFYDKLTWHRVVADFVAQGGDPRGDGDGGPGWALPDEHTPLRFRRGTLGIATNGPDTGGSQLFLCHSDAPHLDGRYTVAGELVSGGEVLDALHVGDSILSATVE